MRLDYMHRGSRRFQCSLDYIDNLDFRTVGLVIIEHFVNRFAKSRSSILVLILM